MCTVSPARSFVDHRVLNRLAVALDQRGATAGMHEQDCRAPVMGKRGDKRVDRGQLVGVPAVGQLAASVGPLDPEAVSRVFMMARCRQRGHEEPVRNRYQLLQIVMAAHRGSPSR